MKLREYLRGKLSDKEISLVPSSFDIVGDIAIFIDFPKELSKKELIIGKSLLELHKNIKVVCKKVKKYSGKYRTAKLKVIAGENRKTTIHVENGTKLMLDVEKVYFSPRSGTERQRIINLVRNNENILVMFSGCGPYTCELAKKVKNIVAIEANPVAHKYALINLEFNKIKNAIALKGDVVKVIPKIKEKFDRIIMPLPKTANKFIKQALKVSKKGTIIHLYSFGSDEDILSLKNDIMKKCKESKKKCKIINVIKAGEYAPHVNRLCFDFEVL